MKRLLFIYLIMLCCMSHGVSARTACHYTSEDSLFVVNALKDARQQKGDVCWTLFFARKLIGRPYVAHTLELFPLNEQLIVNTRQLDCTTLVETATALALCAEHRLTSFADYCEMLQKLRYRNGKVNGYPSRLHYFSQWIDDNSKMGLVAEVQREKAPFTAVQTLNISYMSTHPAAYASLANQPAYVGEIAKQEKQLTGQRFRYIPKAQVRNTADLRSAVSDGDIIAITCSKAGLDIAHVGFAVWHEDGLHLLNASSIHKKVVEEPMTLGEYLKKHVSHTGIRVVKLK